MVRIKLQASQFPADGWSDFSFWYIGVHDENQNEIYRRDLSQAELEPLSLQQPEIVLVCELQSGSIPAALDRLAGQPLAGLAEEDRRHISR